MTWGIWIAVSGLIFGRGLLAALEVALQGISDARAWELAKESPRRGGRLVRLKADPEPVAAAYRAGMVLTGFVAVALSVMSPPPLPEAVAPYLPDWLTPWLSPVVTALLIALAATVVDIVFRSVAMKRPERFAVGLSVVATIAVAVLYPMLKLLIVPLNVVVGLFGAKVSFQAPPPPLEELEKQLIRQAQRQEVDKGAPQLIRSIFELSDKTCRDVMVPRTEVVGIEMSTSNEDILRLIAEENHSRIPVYKEDVDHIVGILHVRDLVPLMQNPELIVLQDLIRPAAFVPWVKSIGDLLREMQRQRIHMAVVVDEYGGFSGIVTLEDILTEIVGDIRDEFDEEVKAYEKQTDGSFLVDAMTPREEFQRLFDFKFPEGEFETVGGYLSHLAGAIPEVNDRFVVNGWTFVVHAKEGPRIDRVRVYKPKPPEKKSSSAKDLEPVPGRTPLPQG